jgi:hypothetical protein
MTYTDMKGVGPADTIDAIPESDRATQGWKNSSAAAGSAVDAMRTTAGQVGDQLADTVDALRVSAVDSARTIQAWPEPTRRLAAGFSLGLGLGLSIAGAPRLVTMIVLMPAIAVTASALGVEAPLRNRS